MPTLATLYRTLDAAIDLLLLLRDALQALNACLEIACQIYTGALAFSHQWLGESWLAQSVL